jgi:predicted O-methyltransferase YrrM
MIQAIKNKINNLFQDKSSIGFPPGHYYSPVPDINQTVANKKQIWKGVTVDGIPGIDLNAEAQCKLLSEFEKYYAEIPFTAQKQEAQRYYFDNIFYSYGDGLNLYSIMRHFKPYRIIEVGSGFSSALMLDVNQQFFDNRIKLSFVEPYTERLDGLLTEADQKNTEIVRKFVQEVDNDYFTKLEANDILFIDSTHVSKIGSDVNYLFFEILPRLKPGVIVHVHDVYYPFEYSEAMIRQGIFWNENYLLRAFLTHNTKVEILLFADYIHKHHTKAYQNLPLAYQNSGANFWFRIKE